MRLDPFPFKKPRNISPIGFVIRAGGGIFEVSLAEK
jgi:hypothetical protein